MERKEKKTSNTRPTLPQYMLILLKIIESLDNMVL